MNYLIPQEEVEALGAQGLTNLLEETESILKENHLGLRNIKYILNSTGYIEIADFVQQAKLTNYDAGYGLVHIDPSLCIVGATWWLAREEYDGKEKWIFLKKPQKPTLKAVDFRLYQNGRF